MKLIPPYPSIKRMGGIKITLTSLLAPYKGGLMKVEGTEA